MRQMTDDSGGRSPKLPPAGRKTLGPTAEPPKLPPAEGPKKDFWESPTDSKRTSRWVESSTDSVVTMTAIEQRQVDNTRLFQVRVDNSNTHPT